MALPHYTRDAINNVASKSSVRSTQWSVGSERNGGKKEDTKWLKPVPFDPLLDGCQCMQASQTIDSGCRVATTTLNWTYHIADHRMDCSRPLNKLIQSPSNNRRMYIQRRADYYARLHQRLLLLDVIGLRESAAFREAATRNSSPTTHFHNSTDHIILFIIATL